MSTSPPSTALRTPSSTPAPEPLSSTGRTGRVRKPIERFGSIVRTDQLYGDGDESDTGTAVEDEGDGDFAGLGGESSEDEIGGQDDDDDEEDDKKRKKVAVKKDKKTTAKKNEKSTGKESKTGASKKLAVGKKDKVVVALAAAKKKTLILSKAKPASSKPAAPSADETRDSDEEEVATVRTDDQTVKAKAKGKRQGIVLAKATKSMNTPAPKTPRSTEGIRRPIASMEKNADGKTTAASPVKPIVIGAKSAKPRAGVQLAAAKKPTVTIAPSPAQSDDDSDSDSAQVSAAKAKIRSRAGTPAVVKSSQVTGSRAEPSKEEEHLQASDADADQPETQLPAKNQGAIDTKNPKRIQQKKGKRALAETSDETDNDDQGKISKESPKGSDADSDGDPPSEAASIAAASPSREASLDHESEGARVSKIRVSLSRSPSPDLIATTPSKRSNKRKTAYEESQAHSGTQRATRLESEDYEISEDDQAKSSDSHSSKTKPTPTPKKAKRKTATSSDRDDESSSTPSKKSKPAPAEKILPEHRVAIIDAFVDKSYLPALNFGAVSRLLAESGVECSAAKLGRHWREVLSSDIKQHVEGSMSAKATKGKKGGGLGVDERQAIWVEVVKHYEKADWKKLEKECGVSTTKLKRHLRDVLDKDVKKFISQ